MNLIFIGRSLHYTPSKDLTIETRSDQVTCSGRVWFNPNRWSNHSAMTLEIMRSIKVRSSSHQSKQKLHKPANPAMWYGTDITWSTSFLMRQDRLLWQYLTVGSAQASQPLSIKMIQFDVSVVAGNGDPILLGDGEPIHGWIRPNGGQRSAHVFQVPNPNSPVVRTGYHFVRSGKHRRRHRLGVALYQVLRN